MTTDGRRERWWGLALGLAVAAADTAGMAALGIRFDMNGRDVSWLVFAYFGSSFALLGFLLGWVREGRRRDRDTAVLVQAQTEAVAAARARLAHHEKLAALGQLAAQVAHEVRNPLAVMRSAAQTLAETLPEDDAEGRRACRFIIEESDRLGSVVASLLGLARPPAVAARAVAVADLLDRALELARAELAAKDVRVRRHAADGVPAVRADADLLCQVVLGLLTNAAAAVPRGGLVEIEARADGGEVELAIADSGPGVPPELRERIFEPFFTTRAHGVGLGLAVARHIATLHGGRIAVGERAGGGARFAVRVPAAA